MSASPEHDEFDPYRIWLGIPKSEQPPTYYRLLGLAEFEADPLVIQEGADRQSAHLRSKQIGQRMAASQKLLAEVATAMGCLLNAESKAKYDRQLRAKQQAASAAAEASTPVIAASFPVARALPVSPAAPLPPVYPQVIPTSPPQPFAQPPIYQTPAQPVFDFQSGPPAPKPAPVETKPGLDPQLLKLIGLGVAGVVGLFTFVLVGGLIYWMSRKPAPAIAQPVPPVVQPKSVTENPFENNVENNASPRNKSLQVKPPPPPNTVTVTPPNGPKQVTPTVNQRPRPQNLHPQAPPFVKPEVLQTPVAATKEGLGYTTELWSHLTEAYLNPSNVRLAEQQAKLLRDVQANTLGGIPTDAAQLPAFRDWLINAAWQLDRQVTQQSTNAPQRGRLLAMLCVSPREAAAQPQGAVMRINGEDQFDERLIVYMFRLVKLAKAGESNPELHDRLLDLSVLSMTIKYAYRRGYLEPLLGCQLLEYWTVEAIKSAPALSAGELRDAMDNVLAGAGFSQTGEDPSNDPRTQFTVEHGHFTTYLRQPNGQWAEKNGSVGGSSMYAEVQRTRTAIVLSPIDRQPGPIVTLTLGWREVGQLSPGMLKFMSPGYMMGQWEIVRSDRAVIGQIRPPLPDQANAPLHFGNRSERPLLSVAASTPSSNPSTNTPAVPNGANVPPDANERFLPKIGEEKPGRSVVTPHQLKPGSRVHIYRAGWLTGQVLAIEDKLVRVRYDNQDSSYDEAVVTRRVRIMVGPDGVPLVAGGPNAPPSASPTSGGPGISSSTPLPPSIQNTDPKRRLWSHPQGFVAMNNDGTWNELTPAGNYYTLALKSITDDYLELQREGKAGTIRLFNKHMEHSPRTYNTFTAGPKGGWITPLEEVEFDPAQQAALKKTVDQYAEALTKARELMLERFDSAITSNSSRVGKAEERLAYIAVLEAEQTRFKTDGLVPFSQPMRQAAVDYISAINRAKSQAEPMFNKALEHFINNGQVDVASAVRVLRQRTLAPILLVKLARMEAGRSQSFSMGAGFMQQEDRELFLSEEIPAAMRLWSGGNLIHVASDARWNADNTGMSLNSPRPMNVTVRDKLVFNDHGNEFSATTQQVPTRNKQQPQKYAGSVLNTLETYERRPTISFVPKGSPMPMPAAEGAAPPAETPAAPAPEAGPVAAPK